MIGFEVACDFSQAFLLRGSVGILWNRG